MPGGCNRKKDVSLHDSSTMHPRTFWTLVKIPAKYLHPEALLNDGTTMSQLETNKSLKEEIEEIF